MPGQVLVERHRVERGVHAAAREEGGQGRGEAEPVRVLGEVERLDPEPVTAQYHAAGVVLGHGEGEHADQVLDAFVPPLGVGLEEHFRVGVGEEAVAQAFEPSAQLTVVVEAPVEDGRDPQVGVGHRLGAALREVDDLQPAVAQGYGAL